jgi:hypothetical protein
MWMDAAALELEALDQVPASRIRTRGVLAVAVVALQTRAGDLGAAQDSCITFLGRRDLPDGARSQIWDALDELRRRAAGFGSDLTGAGSYEWTLRGPSIGKGSAPGGAIIAFLEHVQKYGLRVVEYAKGAPLRTRGAPDSLIAEAFRFRVSQPAAGSFRLRTELVPTNEQASLFADSANIGSKDVSTLFTSILDASIETVTPQGGGDGNQLPELVPDKPYRTTLLRLARLILPDGKDVHEVELMRIGSEPTLLTPAHRRNIDAVLAIDRPPVSGGTERSGILRALDLDRRSIELSGADGRLKCTASKDALVLEDIIGPLVNRPVRVIGHGSGSSFLFTEIFEDDDQVPAST